MHFSQRTYRQKMDTKLTNSLSPATKVLSTEQLCSESPNKSWFLEVEAYEAEVMEVRLKFCRRI